MGQYTQLNHKQYIENKYKSLFCMARIYHYSQKEYLVRRSKIQATNSYQRLTQYNREFMRGTESMFFDDLYRNHLVFCYDYQGKRYRIDSVEYKALSPQLVCENSTFHGYCWKDNLEKAY